jgi:uncharacterized membrane protein
MEAIKGFLTGMIVRWVLKIGGTYFLTIGVENSTVETVVAGAVSILIGVVISLFQQKKAVNALPPQ